MLQEGSKIVAPHSVEIPMMSDKGSLGKQRGKAAAAASHSCGDRKHMLAQAAVANTHFETQIEKR